MQAYLDHASTTPLRPAALAAMLPYLTEHYGNPSSPNAPGRRARQAVDEARDLVADSLGCEPGEVVFCSGGTEAANLAVFGTAAASSNAGRREFKAVCSAIEHHCVLRAVESIGGRVIPVSRCGGRIDFDELSVHGVGADLVAVMLANNEIGRIQPIAKVAEAVRLLAPDAVLVVDAVHAVGWLDVREHCAGADLFFVSAHKFGGPKGVGALVVRGGARATRWAPTGRGGAQERERRPGTENVAGIVGMAAALDVAVRETDVNVVRVSAMRNRLADALCAASPAIRETAVVNGDRSMKVAGSCHLIVDGVAQDELLFLLDREGVFCSAGSACASGASEPNHVLEAIGIDLENPPAAALRLTLGQTTTDSEIDYAIDVVPKVVEHLLAG